jgi:hypothetical protein
MYLKNAYEWLWSHKWDKPGEGWEPESRSFEELGWKWKRDGQPEKLYGCDNEQVPRYNFLGCNIWRKPNNPVEYCWRSGIMVRGENPYVIIVDDVKKDGEIRTYEWYMPIPDDVEFIPQANGSVLLVEKDEQQTSNRANFGSRRLLIVPLGPGKASVKMEEYTSGISKQTAYKGRRIVITRNGTEANFRVLLYPFCTTLSPVGKDSSENWKKNPLGALIPELSPAGRKNFYIKVNGFKDQWDFIIQDDGRSLAILQRGSRKIPIR